MRTLLSLTVTSLQFIACHAQAERHDILDDSFDRMVEDWLEAHHVPGMSIALIHNGTVASKGYGYSVLPDTMASADTLWLTGSTTKAFVAAAAAKLVLNDTAFPAVQWTTPVSQLLPEDFVLSDEHATAHITLEDALSHRTGLPRHDLSYGWTPEASAIETVRLLRHLPFTAEPRTRFQYNNMMYSVANVLLEHMTGTPLQDLLREWLWAPLGMQSTTMSVSEADQWTDAAGRPRFARGYYWTGEYYVPDIRDTSPALAGAGGTISSVNDYALWLQAILDTYVVANDSSPIDRRLVEHVTTPRTLMNRSGLTSTGVSAYALGWELGQIAAHPVVFHGGDVVGFTTSVYLLPRAQVAFVSMENANQGPDGKVGDKAFAECLARLGLVSANEAIEAVSQYSRSTVAPEIADSRSLGSDSDKNRPVRTNPLSGAPEDYFGTYFHPGYGSIHVKRSDQCTVETYLVVAADNPRQSRMSVSGDQTKCRTAPFAVEIARRDMHVFLDFEHVSGTVFKVRWTQGRGIEDSTTGGCGVPTDARPNLVRRLDCHYAETREFQFDGDAVFEWGVDGTVDRLGLQVDTMMMQQVAVDGWRAGMIWFDRKQ